MIACSKQIAYRGGAPSLALSALGDHLPPENIGCRTRFLRSFILNVKYNDPEELPIEPEDFAVQLAVKGSPVADGLVNSNFLPCLPAP